MKCDDLKDWLADSLSGSGGESLDAEIHAHLASCRQCSIEYESLSRLWERLGSLSDAEASTALRARFYSMLDGYKDGIGLSLKQGKRRWGTGFWSERFIPGTPVFQFAIAALFLVAGIVIGRLLIPVASSSSDLAQLREEVHGMKRMVALSLMQQQSASERLAGVSWSQRVRQPDEKVLNALVQALNYDPSVDVRLAAMDALYQFSDQSSVRRALLEALPGQSSPMVQIALIDLMVQLGERQSAGTLRQLADDKNVNEAVRQRARWGLQRLS